MDDYQIIKSIGQGAHSSVYKAKHLQSGIIYALKEITTSKNSLELFIVKKIPTHPNILKYFESFESMFGHSLIFEMCKCDLNQLMKIKLKFSVEEIKTIMQMSLNGLNYLHKLNIMHRDIKPANLLVSNEGIIKIGDFGLACEFYPNKKVEYDHRVGTRWYRSPELLYGARLYGPGIDIWAIGCIFFELFTGKVLFQGTTDIDQLVCVLKTLGTVIISS
jgi:serine/threonine protein kinase